MEQLLHYCWKHKLLPLGELFTTDNRLVEVIDPGLHNRLNGGPDFFNAKVRINGTLWVGNIELHIKSSDWYQHHHDSDPAYNNVVLHVVQTADTDVQNSLGEYLPQLVISIPPQITQHYRELLSTDHYPPCYQLIPSLPPLLIHSWMAALQTERLEQKTQAIERRVKQCNGSWEDAYFVTLARNFGFGINSDAFEQWALAVPLNAVGKHRDDLFQIEAIFMGQAGLLSDETDNSSLAHDDYYLRLQHEYRYLQHKFSLQPIDRSVWRFLRLRPQNFPYIRIAQLAHLYYERKAGLSNLLDCERLEQLYEVLQTEATPYWQTHYSFGSANEQLRQSVQESTAPASIKKLSVSSLNLLVINTAIPILFAVGRHRQKEAYCDRAFDFLEQLKAEKNHIVTMWQECGLPVKSAGDSQALIQLKKEYCDRKDCLRCRIGYEYLKCNNVTTKSCNNDKEQ